GNLAGGTQVQARLTLPDNSLLDPRMQIYRSGQAALAETIDGSPALDATIPANEGGAYYVKIDGSASTRSFLGTYLASFRLLDTIPPEIRSTSLPTEATSAFVDTITLTLSEDLAPASVNAAGRFELRQAGADGLFDTEDDLLVTLAAPNYNGGSQIALPVVDNPLPPGQYRFFASRHLRDRYDNQLAADFVHTFTIVSSAGYVTESIGNGAPETATPLSVAESDLGFLTIGARGRLNVSSENDYWTFEAVAGDTVLIDTDFPGSTVNSKLRFYVSAPDGSIIADFL